MHIGIIGLIGIVAFVLVVALVTQSYGLLPNFKGSTSTHDPAFSDHTG
jgi:hypothetical protein